MRLIIPYPQTWRADALTLKACVCVCGCRACVCLSLFGCVCAPAPVFVCECMGDGHRQHVCVCAGIHDTFCLFTVVLQAATGGPRGNQASLMPLISDLSGMVCVVGVGGWCRSRTEGQRWRADLRFHENVYACTAHLHKFCRNVTLPRLLFLFIK